MSGLPSWPWSARREHPEMDDVHDTERSPVYHDDDELRTIVAELWPAGPPRLFALVQEDEDEDEQLVRHVMAYGIELPGGEAATVGAVPGHWPSADSASECVGSDVLWLSR